MTDKTLPNSIDSTLDLLAKADYIADRSLATVLYLALKMGRPLFVEGEAGVGKTEIAKVLATTLGRRLIRLQCYEGLDVSAAVYEWNYGAQMIAIRLAEAEGEDVLHRLLPEVVIDAVDLALVEDAADVGGQGDGAGEVAPEGLLDDHPRPLRRRRGADEAAGGERVDDVLE